MRDRADLCARAAQRLLRQFALVPIIRMNISRESYLMTDEAGWYKGVGKEFLSHGTIEHGAKEYVRGEISRTLSKATTRSSSAA